MIWKWAIREIRNQYKFSLFFILNVSIGLMGFLCLDAFKTSLDRAFQENAKETLAADVAVRVRRMHSETDLEKARTAIGNNLLQESRTWELFSMVAAGSNSRLIQIKAVDDFFPLYGKLEISNQGIVQSGAPKDINQKKAVWVYPELLSQLDVKVGDFLTLGGEPYEITGTILEDDSQGLRFSAIASNVYVGLSQLRKSSLVSLGTTMTDTQLFKVIPTANVEELTERIKKQITDPGTSITHYQTTGEDSGRALKTLSDYLGLVSLVALFLAALGSAYLFRSFIFSRFYQIAILNSLGLVKRKAQQIYLVQLLILGFGASLISIVGANLLLPVLTGLIKTVAPVSISVFLPLKTMGLAMVMGVFGSLLIGWPFLKPTERLQTSLLLSEGSEVKAETKGRDLLWFLPGLFLYWGLSVWQAQSFQVGSQFVGLFIGSLVALWILGWAILEFLGWLKISSSWTLRQALFSLSRRKLSSLAVVVALGLGTLLMNLLPQLKVSLKEDLTAPGNMKLPSLFLFDIQEDQLPSLETFLSGKGLQLQQKSSLVRARILKVNGVDYERDDAPSEYQTREDENRTRFRNRGLNLTYREKLTDSETLREGRDFSGVYDPSSGKPAELSVEYRFAERMGFEIGDRLVLDVQGVEIEGEIINLRSVKWNSFQPNFFIQTQLGVLEEAPKTFLASIADLPSAQVMSLQTDLVKQFPNVSVIDVARVIEKVLEISDKMSWSLELMAALSLFAGFVVLFSIANYEVRRRSWDLNLLKILGASHQDLFRYLLFEFGLLGFISSFFGVLVSLVVSFIISRIFFEGTYQFDLVWPLVSLVSVTALAILILWGTSYRIVRERPSELLSGSLK